MKKIVLFSLALIMGISLNSKSQDFEIGGSVGYMMSGNVKLNKGSANITNNLALGGFTQYYVSDNVLIEMLYLRKDTKINHTYFLENIDENYDLSVEYYHLGGVKTFGKSKKIKPFGSFSMGMTRYHIKKIDRYSDKWFFSIAPSAGVKMYLSERIGIQIQARLLMPLSLEGYGIFWSTDPGAGTSVSLAVPVLQGEFSGGIFLRL